VGGCRRRRRHEIVIGAAQPITGRFAFAGVNINAALQVIIDRSTEPWGIKVSDVEVKHIDLPVEMQRAMAKQAEAEKGKVTGTAVGCACGDGEIDWGRLVRRLKKAGYKTAFIGKWHMPGRLPNIQGRAVDRFVTFTVSGGQGIYYDCPLIIDGKIQGKEGKVPH
jgi:hypothetical protein